MHVPAHLSVLQYNERRAREHVLEGDDEEQSILVAIVGALALRLTSRRVPGKSLPPTVGLRPSTSERGTRVAALLYSLIESAKRSGAEPKAYLGEAARRAPGSVTLPRDLR